MENRVILSVGHPPLTIDTRKLTPTPIGVEALVSGVEVRGGGGFDVQVEVGRSVLLPWHRLLAPHEGTCVNLCDTGMVL